VTQRRFADAPTLLGDLLDRYEARPSAERLISRVDPAAFGSIAEFDACIAELEMVERAGGVTLRRRRAGGAQHVESVRLANPEPVYGHLGRTPAPRAAGQALAQLDIRAAGRPELVPIFDEVRRAWGRNVNALGLAPGETSRLALAVDLAEALLARGDDGKASQLDFRSFSRAVTGDSKALERLAGTVRGLLERLREGEPLEGPEAFAAYGVVRLPPPFLVSGRLLFAGHELPSVSYLGFDPLDARRLEPAEPPAYVLIIENFTSFVRHAREVNAGGDGLVIFSGGFPSRAALEAIVELAARAPAPTFHWGDLDGGVRIFVHLEQALAARGVPLRPHLMSRELLETRGTSRRESVRVLGPAPDGTAIAELWQALVRTPNLQLEQEAVDPVRPLG
jgi:hypothetical protein